MTRWFDCNLKFRLMSWVGDIALLVLFYSQHKIYEVKRVLRNHSVNYLEKKIQFSSHHRWIFYHSWENVNRIGFA